MFRTHTCGELRISDVNKQVTLSGWVQRSRKMGGMTFIDLRDRYGITQLVFNEEVNAELCERANKLGREFVIQVKGTVNERFSKNANIPTGDIEIIVSELNVLNTAMTPPFTIEDNTSYYYICLFLGSFRGYFYCMTGSLCIHYFPRVSRLVYFFIQQAKNQFLTLCTRNRIDDEYYFLHSFVHAILVDCRRQK